MGRNLKYTLKYLEALCTVHPDGVSMPGNKIQLQNNVNIDILQPRWSTCNAMVSFKPFNEVLRVDIDYA